MLAINGEKCYIFCESFAEDKVFSRARVSVLFQKKELALTMVRNWLIILSCFVFLTNIAFADKVLELHFDEGEGEIASDTSGQGNDGKVMGAEWVDGKFGKALQFDGAGTHVEIQDSPSLQITDEMTVAAWAFFHFLGASGNHDAIAAKSNTWSFITFRRSNPAYQFAWWDNVAKNLMPGEPKWIVSDWVPEIETWYHLAVTMKSGDTLLFYRDGEVIKESPYPLAVPAGAGQPIWVGKGNGATENMEGIVDELMIFNTALSQNDIEKLAGISGSVKPAGKLVTEWGKLKQSLY